MKKTIQRILFVLLILTIQAKGVIANHIIGAEINYTCTSNIGIYSVTAKIYRDCSNTQFCTNCPTSLNSNCNIPISIIGSGPTTVTGVPSSLCDGVNLGILNLSVITSISGYDVIQLCSGKTICTNCGTRTPGTITPGIEVYVFSGVLNLSTLPSSCCYVNLGYSTCCRSYGINSIINSGLIGFYSFATINRCETNCNSAPVFTFDPSFIGCSGQEFNYNLGAIDPDGDSLSYSFGSALVSGNSPVPCFSPYSAQLPVYFQGFPVPSPPAIPPNGISINSVTGDVRFKPIGVSLATIVFEVRQWKRFASVPTLLGVTRREVQFYSQICAPNNPPTLKVYNKDGSAIIEPLYFNHSICANNELCFIVVAKDIDSINDTTNLNLNLPPSLLSKGATFTKLYNPATRHINGPKYDSVLFCWTPTSNDINTMPYSFVATAEDKTCPLAGRIMKTFIINVKNRPEITINKVSKPCSFYQLGYTINNTVTVNPFATKFFAETAPHSNQFVSYTTNDGISHGFSKTGWHKVGVQVSTYAPPMPNGCVKETWDSVYVAGSVKVGISDTSFCGNNSIQVKASGSFGMPFGSNYLYTFYKGGFGSKQQLRAQNADSSCLIQPPYTNDSNTYFVRILDQLGCTDSAEFRLFSRAEPTREMPLSKQFCYGKTDSINAGNNAGTVKNWEWKKLNGQLNLTDSLQQKIWPNTSGKYVVKKVNQYTCSATDTIEVLLLPDQLALINPNQPLSVCEGESVLLNASIAPKQSYKWYINTINQLPLINASILVYENGNYHVVITDSNACSKTSNIVNVLVNTMPQLLSIAGESSPVPDSIYAYEVSRLPSHQYLWDSFSASIGEIWGSQDSNVVRISWVPTQGLITHRLKVKVTNDKGCFRKFETLIPISPRKPEITSFAPMVAGKNGQVTIYGKFFIPAATSQVRFGGSDAASFQVISSTQITAVLDTGASGDVEVFSTVGSARKNGFMFLTTGLNVIEDNSLIQLFPNPTQGKVTINLDNVSLQNVKTIRVLNGLGQELLQQAIDKNQVTLDLSKYGNLTYCFIEILNQNSERVFLEKVIFAK
jgi:hypothetical protein